MATPNTNLIFRRFGNGIRDVITGKFYPFRTGVLSGTVSRSARLNTRFYVDSVLVSYTALAADTGTTITLTGKINGEDNYLVSLVKTTLLAGTASQEISQGVLLDKEVPLVQTASNITAVQTVVRFAEVDDLA